MHQNLKLRVGLTCVDALMSNDRISCAVAVALTVLVALDIVVPLLSSDVSAVEDGALHTLSGARLEGAAVALPHARRFVEQVLTPYLADVASNVDTTLKGAMQVLEHAKADVAAVLQRQASGGGSTASAGGGRAGGGDQLPWWAAKRSVVPSVRKVDFASFTTSMDGFLMRQLAADHMDGVKDNITFATNTVDKLNYQLRNFEPMSHRFSQPQWNGISLRAQQRLGAKHPRAMLIGISSVNRQTNYLVATLISLLKALDDEEKHMIHVVIFNGNYPPEQHSDIAAVRLQFAAELSTGLFEIVELQRPHGALSDPSKLARRWGDTLERVRWRSKQVLDVAYLMAYCAEHNLGYQYFLMMEDDIVASKHFVRRLREWVDTHSTLSNTDWTMLSFYNPWPVQDMEQLPPNKFFGVIGQLFRMHDLPVVCEFLVKNFDQSPLDWLFVDFLKKFGGSIVVHTPSLFQHQGTVSSLEGKRQEGQSVDFVEEER